MRRDFELVANDALDRSYSESDLTPPEERRLRRALQRPRARERLRAEFVRSVDPQSLKLAEVAGKIDFDKLFGALVEFFPKLSRLSKYAGVLKVIVGLER